MNNFSSRQISTLKLWFFFSFFDVFFLISCLLTPLPSVFVSFLHPLPPFPFQLSETEFTTTGQSYFFLNFFLSIFCLNLSRPPVTVPFKKQTLDQQGFIFFIYFFYFWIFFWTMYFFFLISFVLDLFCFILLFFF